MAGRPGFAWPLVTLNEGGEVESLERELPTWDPYWRSQLDHIVGREVDKFVLRSHYYRLLEHLFDRIRLDRSRPVSVLEAGSGSGILSIALLRQRGDHIRNITLLDKSQVGLAL